MRYSATRVMQGLSRSVIAIATYATAMVWSSSVAAGDSAQDVLDRMKRKYDAINDAQLSFSQRTRFELSKVEQRLSGTLYVKKENKYRVETSDQTVVTNGETVWSYSASNKQVLIDHFKADEASITPEKVLAGAPTEFSSTMVGNERIGTVEVTVLKLTPKNDQSALKTMKLWVDNSTWLIKKAEIVDVGGKQTEYLVTDVKINTGLQDSRFTYQIPEGTEVVDLR